MSEKKHALTIGYNSDGDADKLVEVQASALQVSSFDLADVASNHIPTENQVLAYSAVGDGTFLYAPSTIVTGGGGGGGGTFNLPTGAVGDILRYTATDAVNPISFTGAGLATTAIVEAASDALVPRDGAFTATGPATFATNPVSFPAGYNATGPITVTGPLNVTGPSTHEGPFTFDRKPLVGDDEVVISNDLNAYVTEVEFDGSAGDFYTTATGDSGSLILKGGTTGNTTTAQTPAAFIAANSILIEPTDTTATGDVLVKKSDGTLEGKAPSELPFSTGLNVTGPAVFTGVASFTQKPTVADTTVAISTDLDAYVTETEYDTSASLFTTTGTFVTTTGTLLEKPSTGGAGELLVYNAGNDTATTSVSDFLTDNSLVTFTNFGTQLTNNGGLTQTTGDVRYVLSSAATNNQIYFNNAGTPDGSDSTAAGRAFINTTCSLGSITDVALPTDAEGQIEDGAALVWNESESSWSATLVAGVKNPLKSGNLLVQGSASITDDASFSAKITAPSADFTDLNVFKTGQMNPTCYIHESDWLTAGTAANGFGQSNTGTGAGTGQCFDNDVMHPDKGTIGVIEVRSGTDAFGRCFMTTFNNALAVSSCSVSFTSRIAPSGLWVNGVNEGKMCFGIRNGTSNAAATYAMEFQYGAGGGQANTTWSAVVTDNSNSTVSDTGVVVSAQEFNVLQVSCNQDWSEVDFYVDGVNKAQFSLAAGHKIPDSRFNRMGLAWAINNANIFSTSNNTDGNEIFVDWHQYRLKATTRVSGNRGKDLIQ